MNRLPGWRPLPGLAAIAGLAVALWLCGPLPQAAAQVEGAPLQGSMTLTAFEWRVEIALDGRMLREIGAVDADDEFVIRPDSARAGEIAAAASRWLGDTWQTASHGQPHQWRPAASRWVQWRADEGFVADDRAALPVEDARLAIGFVRAPSPPGLPDELTWTWQRFPADSLALVPLGIHSDRTSSQRLLSPGRAELVWRRDDDEPPLPPAPPSPPPPPEPAPALPMPMPMAAGLLLALGLAAWFLPALRRRHHHQPSPPAGRRWRVVGTLCVILAGALLVIPTVRPQTTPPPAADEARQVLQALLAGMYRALDHRDDEAIYQALEQVAHGPLLRQLHLEHRQALSMAHLGDAVAAVQAVHLDHIGPLQALPPAAGDPPAATAAPGFSGEAEWTVDAALSHWGHHHERQLRYRAIFDIRAIDHHWRLTSLALREPDEP